MEQIDQFISGIPVWLKILILVWATVWRGFALWKSARLSHTKWFVVLCLVNTLGILEIIYIFFVAKKYSVEVIESNK
jgi:hypothetical protein